jgi:hypothetical protein
MGSSILFSLSHEENKINNIKHEVDNRNAIPTTLIIKIDFNI